MACSMIIIYNYYKHSLYNTHYRTLLLSSKTLIKPLSTYKQTIKHVAEMVRISSTTSVLELFAHKTVEIVPSYRLAMRKARYSAIHGLFAATNPHTAENVPEVIPVSSATIMIKHLAFTTCGVEEESIRRKSISSDLPRVHWQLASYKKRCICAILWPSAATTPKTISA